MISPAPSYGTAFAPGAPVAPAPKRKDFRVAMGFVLLMILCQLALIVPALAPLRIVWRMGTFAVSLGLMALLRGRARRLPVSVFAFWALVLLTFAMFNPSSNSAESALADWAMYVAVLAPVFWVPRLRFGLAEFRNIIAVLWLFSTASMIAGLLQVYDPGRFIPPLSPLFNMKGPLAEAYKIVLSNGKEIFRPMGLTDTPGGASVDALWSILFGLGFMLTSRYAWRRVACAAAIVGSLVCVVLSQSRASLVVIAIWAAALAAILTWRRMYRYLFLLVLCGAGVTYFGGRAASHVASAQTLARLEPLAAGHTRASELYTSERGVFLSQTLQFAEEFPLGAGMGRWGMMYYYFGHAGDPNRDAIYVEIQWTAWVLDGGIPLVLLYLLTVGAAVWGLIGIMRRGNPMWFWAALIGAYDIGAIAICFDYTPFTGQPGIEFWFLNSLVLTAALQLPARGRPWPRLWGGAPVRARR